MTESAVFSENETKTNLVPVYHATRPELVPLVLDNGPLPMHEEALMVFPGDNHRQVSFKRDLKCLYNIFDEVAMWIKPTFQRANSVFARVTLDACITSDPVFKLLINPDEVLVADQNNFDVALEQFSYGFMDRVYYRAQKYWSTAVTLKDFSTRNTDFDFPEVLIPNYVTKAQISIHSK